MKTRPTTAALEAIVEALVARTAGEIDVEADKGSPRGEDYEAALRWTLVELATRRKKRPARTRR
jgi:hypothetical protein